MTYNDDVFDTIVPDAEPTAYLSVCVNDDDAGESVIVLRVPIVREPTDGAVALGIVGSVTVAEPVICFKEFANEQSAFHESVTEPVPSVLCCMTQVP